MRATNAPPPPPPPAHTDLRDFYYEQKAHITNIKPAIPSVLVPKDLRKVPDAKLIDTYY